MDNPVILRGMKGDGGQGEEEVEKVDEVKDAEAEDLGLQFLRRC
jgi:hypothetical protein